MRKTSLDLDQESTIISILAFRSLPVAGAPSKGFPLVKVLLGCATLLLLVFVLLHQGSTSWK